MKVDSTLEDFSLAPVSHTGLFGVFIGVHAVDDALCVLHTGVGCKAKTQARLVHHDLGRESHTRVGWTELSEEELIRDPAERLPRAIAELYQRRQPSVIVLVSSTAVEYTGIDLTALAARARAELGCPVIHIPKVSGMPDLQHGYAAVIRAMLQEIDWTTAPGDRISLVGYLFHRHELEQAANLAELKRLAGALGARLGPTFLGGESFKSLGRAGQSGLLACLPCGDLHASELAGLTGRPAIDLGLPVGLRATGNWLRRLGAGLGLPESRIEEVVISEEAKALPRLEQVRRRLPRLLAGPEIAIVADTPNAAGLTMLASELGLTATVVALTDRPSDPGERFRRLLGDTGGVELITRPTLNSLRNLADRHTFHLAIRPDLSLAGTAWERIPTVEYGFPANRKHFVYPMPELGYAGAVALAQRIMDAASGAH